MNQDDEPLKGTTIYALSSGALPSGVAVVRLSGPHVRLVLERFVGDIPPARSAVFRPVRHPKSGEVLDRALVAWFAAPKSFTGEDVVEFHLHGGRAVVSALLDALSSQPGLCLAEPGAFTRRAFDNSKLDLTAAEGLADLISAETEAQRRQALRQSDGALQVLYDGWRERLIYALAMVEAALDFSDEDDVPGDVAAKVLPVVEALAQEIGAHLDDGNRGEILRDGFRVVIAGPANAGKSSLLNALARRDAAIVSDEAGTTRDVIEVRLDLGGLPVIVTDTAGFRDASGSIEREGIRRSVIEARNADLILWLRALDQLDAELPDALCSETHKVIEVLSKTDLLEKGLPMDGEQMGGHQIAISVQSGTGVDALTGRLKDEASRRLGSFEHPAVTNARQRLELERCLNGLEVYLLGRQEMLELRAEDLRVAAQALGRITGRVDVEDVLDRIFSAFCIGK